MIFSENRYPLFGIMLCETKSAPASRGAPHQSRGDRLRGLLGVDHLGRTAADRNLARLRRLGNLALEVDVQEAVLQARALDLDMVGELEAPLERAGRDALVEHVAVLAVLLGLLVAADRERVLLHLDRQIVLGEAGDRNGHAIGVIVGALDVVGRVAGRSFVEAADLLVEQRKQTVEADGRTIEGSKIESS